MPGQPCEEAAPSGAASRLHPLSEPLPFGQLFDAGIRDYGEFACSRATYQWLADGGMQKIDGQGVHLQVMEECVGGHNLLVKAWTT